MMQCYAWQRVVHAPVFVLRLSPFSQQNACSSALRRERHDWHVIAAIGQELESSTHHIQRPQPQPCFVVCLLLGGFNVREQPPSFGVFVAELPQTEKEHHLDTDSSAALSKHEIGLLMCYVWSNSCPVFVHLYTAECTYVTLV